MMDKPGVYNKRDILQIIPPLPFPEPKPYYGLEFAVWATMNDAMRQEAKATYLESVDALRSIYAGLLDPIAVVK